MAIVAAILNSISSGVSPGILCGLLSDLRRGILSGTGVRVESGILVALCFWHSICDILWHCSRYDLEQPMPSRWGKQNERRLEVGHRRRNVEYPARRGVWLDQASAGREAAATVKLKVADEGQEFLAEVQQGKGAMGRVCGECGKGAGACARWSSPTAG